jgi:tetratricopeptide (TPR) repeat protein
LSLPKKRPYSLTVLGRLRHKQGRYADAEQNCTMALDCVTEFEDKYAEAHTHHALGEIYADQGLLKPALSAFQQALSVYKQLGIKKEITRLEDRICEINAISSN